jgi:hypothetical protein
MALGGVVLAGWFAGGARGGSPLPKNVADARALAARIDHHIDTRQVAEKVKAVALSDDAEFFRRVSLDLTGHIPSLLDIRDFLDDDRPDKRSIWVEQMLENETYANHFANVWRHILLPQNNQFNGQFLSASMEAWLRGHLKENTPYDKIVRELMTAPVFNQGGSNPSVFYQANEFKVENLAANTSRLFLGHKLECAQCHDHPFAKWTREQFWEYAAFFGGIGPQRVEAPNVREIKITGTNKVVKARFLDGTEPKWPNGNVSSRIVLAEWLTQAKNPYFARATVNKVWAYFFGIGLIDPLDEENDDNPPSHPELLDELAREFAAHQFDLKFLIRAIVSSRAYQRTSSAARLEPREARLYTRMAVRGMSPEQLFDSVATAIDYKDQPMANNRFNQFGQLQTPRGQFLNRFENQEKRSETETSILQALFMMNGQFMAQATSLKQNKTLEYIATSTLDPAKRIEQLYLITLSRKPKPHESARLVKYVTGGGKSGDPKKAFEDVLWVLLNSAEFMLNH